MNGRTTPASTLERIHAPSTAPRTPAMPRRITRRQSTLRCQMCEPADAAVVKISAVCTSALACAGGMPIESIAVVEMTPNAIPSAPATSCARKPIAPSKTYSVTIVAPSVAVNLSRKLRFGKRDARRMNVDACGRFDAIMPPKQDSHGKKGHFNRRAEDSWRAGEKSSLALKLDHPSRQSHP